MSMICDLRVVDLIKELPFFMQEYKEIIEIMSTEDEEFRELYIELCRLLTNLFVITAEEDGIVRYEQMLKIYPFSDDTLEIRRARILAKINNDGPYTMRKLKQMLDVLCGQNNYKVTLDAGNRVLNIDTFFYDSRLLKELNEMLLRVLPANLSTISSNYIIEEMKSTLYVGMDTSTNMNYILSSDFIGNYEINSSMKFIGINIDNKKYELGG